MDELPQEITSGMNNTDASGDLALSTLMRNLEGDSELARELVEIFLEDCPKHMLQIRTAIDHRDSKALGRAAHSLRGAIDYLANEAASHAALELEKIAGNSDLTGAKQAMNNLEKALARLMPTLAAFCET